MGSKTLKKSPPKTMRKKKQKVSWKRAWPTKFIPKPSGRIKGRIATEKLLKKLEEKYKKYKKGTNDYNYFKCMMKQIRYHISSYGYILKHIKKVADKKNIKDVFGERSLAIAVGDGNYPQTGFLLSSVFKGDVLSVDPALKKTRVGARDLPSNLKMVKDIIEKVKWGKYRKSVDTIVAVAVYAHVNMNKLWRRLVKTKKNIILVSIPCCFPHTQKVTDKRANVIGNTNKKKKYERIGIWAHSK